MADADPGVTFAPIRSDVIGFDSVHQAVQARLCREPTGPEVAASAAASAEAAQTAASTRDTPAPRLHHDLASHEAAAVAQAVAAQEGGEASAAASARSEAAASAAASASSEAAASAETAYAAAWTRRIPLDDLSDIDDSSDIPPDDFLEADWDVVVLATGADVVQALDLDAQAAAAQEDDEATVAHALGPNAQEEQEEEDEGQEDAMEESHEGGARPDSEEDEDGGARGGPCPGSRCRCLDARSLATSSHEVPHRRAQEGWL